MHAAALALLLAGAAPAQGPTADNFDFRNGKLTGWEGEGFYVTAGDKNGPSLSLGVSSSDRGEEGQTALLHRSFTVPPGAGVLYARAYAQYGKDCRISNDLDIILFAAGKRLVPKRVHSAKGWEPVTALLPRKPEQPPREYIWYLTDYVGQSLRLVLVDEDRRPGCHVFCNDIRFFPYDEFEGREFSKFMHKLTTEQKLNPVSRFDSEHFVALSNADEEFTATRLNNCELIYDVFLEHFGKKGFRVREPAGKMMVAIFDKQAGFEAYVGQKMSPMITGLYHPKSNRLIVYDYGQNELFVAQRKRLTNMGKRIRADLPRIRFVATINRMASEFRTEANIGTIMHEVSHQLSFNTGLLNREGDVPLWLAEGLACYCEATENSTWQGIGEPNPERLQVFANMEKNRGLRLIPLEDMLASDAWLHKATSPMTPLIGYAQSWALFRMLMEERPQQLRNYLDLIYTRPTDDRRMADFHAAFGRDLPRLQLRFGEYIKEMLAKQKPLAKK